MKACLESRAVRGCPTAPEFVIGDAALSVVIPAKAGIQ
jgi:hypothetical protein